MRANPAATTIKRALAGALLIGFLVTGCGRKSGPTGVPAKSGVAPSPPVASDSLARRARASTARGVRAYRRHRYAEARALFTSAIRILPNDAEARYDRARTYEALHQWSPAIGDLRIASIARPQWSNARLQLGIALFHLKAYASSANDFDAVLKRSPKISGIWLDAGVSYYRLGRWKIAADRFRHAVALAPRSGRARLWLGLSYRKLGQRTMARRELLLASRSRDVATRRSARSALRRR